MIARKWKARCPKNHEKGFIAYLHKTGIKEASETPGYLGAQIFVRNVEESSEITLVTYWGKLNDIQAFAGNDIHLAKLYPEDEKFQLAPDHHVDHYHVIENSWSPSNQ